MATLNVLIAVCITYVMLLFVVAYAAERAAEQGRDRWVRSPLVYTLSLSIYCTAWTFYGAVGNAARSGLEFLTIYIGPSLVMLGWWWILRRLVCIGRNERITSIADLLSARFGKSNLVAVTVTILAVIGTTPYIALQLQSVVLSFGAFVGRDQASFAQLAGGQTALWVALGLIFFTILFGTRNLDVNERHHGVVMAIAVEAVVKIVALGAVGIFVIWGINGGIGPSLARIDASPMAHWDIGADRWATLIFLSAAAYLCLPRMFQVMVVENESETHLRTASWAFPLYLLGMSLFVLPIAVAGLDLLPAGTNPDLFVLSVPLIAGENSLAILSFLGGFSSASSMVIVASLALATMVSNHIVVPIWLWLSGGDARAAHMGDMRAIVMMARRLSIAGIVGLGYLYYVVSGDGVALASIGLVAFAAVAQFLPPMIGGLFWQGATRNGAMAGLLSGFCIWAYLMVVPQFADGLGLLAMMEAGPWGITWLAPRGLFGISGMDPLVHAVLWSISINALMFVLVSLMGRPGSLEQVQGARFITLRTQSPRWQVGDARIEDLRRMADRILGARASDRLFDREARRQGLINGSPELDPPFLQNLERALAGAIGASTAHAMVTQASGTTQVSVADLMAMADETAQMMEHSNQLELKSEELARTARKLRRANEKLTQISVQKDAFLSQISHELRTPMTSIRAFSEILRDGDGKDAAARSRHAGIIHDEALRLTRLLDDLLDLSVLESGQVSLNRARGSLVRVLDQAIATALTGAEGRPIRLKRTRLEEAIELDTDLDRLAQVFINLINNAQKYCDAEDPRLRIQVESHPQTIHIDFIDNGSGIPETSQEVIFEKFARVSDQKAGGAGLGLAICREIMRRLGGDILYLPGRGGAGFRVILPKGVK